MSENEAQRFEATYEILTYERARDRWILDGVIEDESEAQQAAMNLLAKPAVAGVRVVREIYDRAAAKSYGRVVLETIKETTTRAGVRTAR